MLALRLANGGWWGGDPGAVLRAPADEVMLAVQYEDFKHTFEIESLKIAKEDSK